mmetsp:Transcript_13064/g.36656  ORF Transcript_13064/g.36656 Transcript_13064/m.36656 type:complete len:256 (-) Transcript_13064:320-1087(-)
MVVLDFARLQRHKCPRAGVQSDFLQADAPGPLKLPHEVLREVKTCGWCSDTSRHSGVYRLIRFRVPSLRRSLHVRRQGDRAQGLKDVPKLPSTRIGGALHRPIEFNVRKLAALLTPLQNGRTQNHSRAVLLDQNSALIHILSLHHALPRRRCLCWTGAQARFARPLRGGDHQQLHRSPSRALSHLQSGVDNFCVVRDKQASFGQERGHVSELALPQELNWMTPLVSDVHAQQPRSVPASNLGPVGVEPSDRLLSN